MDTESKLNSGRVNQKHRTRNALLEAAAELMRQGHVPSIEEIADAAHVSRATAYRYFPTQEHILAGSAVLKANMDGDVRLGSLLTSTDPATRLDNVVQAFHERFSSNEVAYRTLLSVMLQKPGVETGDEAQPQQRASRQIHWLQEALIPIQSELGTDRFDRLLMALVTSTGFEAYTALRDVCRLDPLKSEEMMRWIAQTLLKSSLAEAKEPTNGVHP